ncbi:MAG TPA: alpha-hydroxy acid oxidase [Gemmatimonadaceae bacterium]|nr:alpha-hydroxy acid oxidase [Gemmatimonadaceae bacterium]
MPISRRHALKSGVALGASVMIDRTTVSRVTQPAETSQGKTAPPLLTLEDYERAARAKVDPVAWEYIASGAADEISLRWNMDAYRSVRLVPHQLRDVSALDTSVTLLGTRLAHPILLAPTACHKLAHPDGELGTGRGAKAAGAGMVLSSYTTVPVETVATEKPSLFWFQLYVQDRAYTEQLLHRAVSAGATAIAVTVDTPISGPRNRQDRSGFVFPPNLPHISGTRAEHPLTWKDLEWIQRAAGVPLFLKGILHPDDADQGVKSGAAGIMVSNHGGRNLDTALATIDALPAIVDRVNGRVPVIVDGGIRRGTDVLKALAYGASAVMIGRPYVHGLAVNGPAGVEAVIGILRRELEMAMMLTGCASLSAIDRGILGGACQRT